MKQICIIPARGGSKRIPRKNIYKVNGKPLIQINIERLTASDLFDEIVVSSDDPEILDISKLAGAEVHERSHELADDFTSADAVIKEVIELRDYPTPTIVTCVYAPNVLFPISKLCDAIKMFKTDNCPVITVCKFKHPLERALVKDENDRSKIKLPEFANIRTQDCQELYFDAGQFYVANAKQWLISYDFLNNDNYSIELKNSEFVDLDDHHDLQILCAALRNN